ncbi:hypothetical protein Tco_0309516 [Tanacetum coccineum]
MFQMRVKQLIRFVMMHLKSHGNCQKELLNWKKICQNLRQRVLLLNRTAHKSRENNSLKTFQKENENFMASLQIENVHLKQTYKDLFDSVQRSRVETNNCNEVKVKIDELEKSLAKQIKENFDLLIKIDNLENVFADEEKRATLGKLNAFDNENCDFESKVIHLEKIIAQKSKDFDDVNLELSNRTAKFEAYFEKLKKTKVVLERQLARKVDDSKAEKDRFLKEINHLRTQLENLKGKRVETKLDNSLILGKPPLLNNERDQLLKQIASLESKLASQDIHSCQKEYHELRTSYNALKVKFDSLNRKKWNINVSKSSKPKESVLEKVHTGESSKPFLRRVSQFTTYSLQKDRKSEVSGKSQIELYFIYKDPIFESQDMSTSNTHQQSLADAGSKTRPLMLERGSYIPRASHFRRYLNRKRKNRKWLNKEIDEGPYEFKEFTPSETEEPRMQTEEDLRGDDLKHYKAEIEAMNLILISIPNDIYNSVDACTTAQVMCRYVVYILLIQFLNLYLAD